MHRSSPVNSRHLLLREKGWERREFKGFGGRPRCNDEVEQKGAAAKRLEEPEWRLKGWRPINLSNSSVFRHSICCLHFGFLLSIHPPFFSASPTIAAPLYSWLSLSLSHICSLFSVSTNLLSLRESTACWSGQQARCWRMYLLCMYCVWDNHSSGGIQIKCRKEIQKEKFQCISSGWAWTHTVNILNICTSFRTS